MYTHLCRLICRDGMVTKRKIGKQNSRSGKKIKVEHGDKKNDGRIFDFEVPMQQVDHEVVSFVYKFGYCVKYTQYIL